MALLGSYVEGLRGVVSTWARTVEDLMFRRAAYVISETFQEHTDICDLVVYRDQIISIDLNSKINLFILDEKDLNLLSCPIYCPFSFCSLPLFHD